MNSRETILSKLKAAKPDFLPLTKWEWEQDGSNVKEKFISTLEGIGGSVKVIGKPDDIKSEIHSVYGENKLIVNTIAGLLWKKPAEDLINQSAEYLEKIDVTIIEGQIGVAENGAIWVDAKSKVHRALPFICQHLVIVLPINKIVANLHEAYSQIDITKNGFGAFIAGPSKTADIEQALVIGAHGARSLTVYLVNDSGQ